MSGTNIIWVIVALIGVVIAWAISIYNSLVERKNYVGDAWSGIEVQLKKRHNLVPNLVNTVKGYAEHESRLLKEVTGLRAPKSGDTPEATSALEQVFSKQLGEIMVQVQAYPDLKADGSFRRLQEQLAMIEGEIEHARRDYNGLVHDLNTRIQSFPSNLIAQKYAFTEAPLFELDGEAARQVPQVDFSQ